ncbi:MAG: AI-2E family transporter [bacterium]
MSPGDLTYKKIFRILLFALAGITLLLLAIQFFDLIIMLVVSVLLAFIFNPVVLMGEKIGLPRIMSILAVFALSILFVVFGFMSLIPKIVNQMNSIAQSFNQENINQFLKDIEHVIAQYLPFLDPSKISQQFSNFISSIFFDSVNNLSEILTSLVSILAIIFIVPFMTFFILKDSKRIVKGIVNIMPNKYFEVSYSVIRKIADQLGRYVRGWILDASIVGVLAGSGLAILGVDNAVSIGFVAGVGHLIPYFGPVIGGLPAILISLIQFGDLTMLPRIVLLFVIIYTFDNGYIQPKVFSAATDMHPLLIIVLIVAGSQVLGIFGMLLAIPTATVIKTASREIYSGFKNYKIIRAQ